jgi:hypothetical protein
VLCVYSTCMHALVGSAHWLSTGAPAVPHMQEGCLQQGMGCLVSGLSVCGFRHCWLVGMGGDFLQSEGERVWSLSLVCLWQWREFLCVSQCQHPCGRVGGLHGLRRLAFLLAGLLLPPAPSCVHLVFGGMF